MHSIELNAKFTATASLYSVFSQAQAALPLEGDFARRSVHVPGTGALLDTYPHPASAFRPQRSNRSADLENKRILLHVPRRRMRIGIEAVALLSSLFPLI